jgi:hypothetical protein
MLQLEIFFMPVDAPNPFDNESVIFAMPMILYGQRSEVVVNISWSMPSCQPTFTFDSY